MTTYAVGDVQGCYDQLRRLLDTVRFVRDLGQRAITVLGNHDLHLLVVAAGVRKPHRGDTLDDILRAHDRDELLDWLRGRHMMHVDSGYSMVHAGLLPQWTIQKSLSLAHEVESALQGDEYFELLQNMYGNEPTKWSDSLSGYDRLRVIINAMTRLRLCDAHGRMEFSHKTGLRDAPAGYLPWFDVPGRASTGTPVVCGHWAALGVMLRGDLFAIDSGCVWGRKLSALRLEDRQLVQCDCLELQGTGSEQ